MNRKTSNFHNSNNNKIIDIEQNSADKLSQLKALEVNMAEGLEEMEHMEKPSRITASQRLRSAIAKARGIRLKIIRVMTGLNLKDFGSICKIESGMFGRYERGETPLSPSSALKVSITVRDLYSIYTDPNWILHGEGACPFKLDKSSEKNITTMIDLYDKYDETYKLEAENFNVFDSAMEDFLVKSGSVVAGVPVNLENNDQLQNIENENCLIKMKNGEKLIAIVNYDKDEEIFVIKLEKDFKLRSLKLSEIESMHKIFFTVYAKDAESKFALFTEKN